MRKQNPRGDEFSVESVDAIARCDRYVVIAAGFGKAEQPKKSLMVVQSLSLPEVNEVIGMALIQTKRNARLHSRISKSLRRR